MALWRGACGSPVSPKGARTGLIVILETSPSDVGRPRRESADNRSARNAGAAP